MANRTQVSICIDDLFAASKAGHPAITKSSKNNKSYARVDIWENDETDAHGNDFSVSLYDKATKKATYIGNGRKYNPNATPNNSQSNDSSEDLQY